MLYDNGLPNGLPAGFGQQTQSPADAIAYLPSQGDNSNGSPRATAESGMVPGATTYNPLVGGPGPETGWICPVCGAGMAPRIDRCPCVGTNHQAPRGMALYYEQVQQRNVPGN